MTTTLSVPAEECGMHQAFISQLCSTFLCNLQMALLSIEICSLREENKQMRVMADVQEPSEQLQSAIRDRDDAIAK